MHGPTNRTGGYTIATKLTTILFLALLSGFSASCSEHTTESAPIPKPDITISAQAIADEGVIYVETTIRNPGTTAAAGFWNSCCVSGISLYDADGDIRYEPDRCIACHCVPPVDLPIRAGGEITRRTRLMARYVEPGDCSSGQLLEAGEYTLRTGFYWRADLENHEYIDGSVTIRWPGTE